MFISLDGALRLVGCVEGQNEDREVSGGWCWSLYPLCIACNDESFGMAGGGSVLLVDIWRL